MFLGYKMSLLKWQEMAKSKSALGKKINFVHNAITQKRLGEETSQIGFEKMFKPVTSKLDDVMGPSAVSNLPDGSLRSHAQKQPARRKKANLEGIDYFPDVDPFEDMDVEGLFDEAVPPQAEKQIPAGPPPSYDEMIKELGDDPPPEYEEDDSPDYALAPGDESSETEEANKLLGSLNIRSYDTVDATLAYSKLSATQRRNYLEKRVLPEAIYRRNQLKGYKSSFTKKWQKGEITEEQKNWQHQRIDRSSRALSDYIKHYRAREKAITGSGIVRFSPIPKNFSRNLRSSLAPFLLEIQTSVSEIPGWEFSISS